MKKLFLFLLFLGSFSTNAQDTLTLQQCFDLAKKNELQIGTLQGQLSKSLLNQQLHYFSFLPTISANLSLNSSFGRKVDPITNLIFTKNINSQFLGLSSSIPVFNGFNYFYQRHLYKMEISRNQVLMASFINDQNLKLLDLYSEVCKLSMQLELSSFRLKKYAELQSIQRLLLKEGRISVIDTLRNSNVTKQENTSYIEMQQALLVKSIELNFLIGLPLKTQHVYSSTSISQIVEELQLKERYDLTAILNEIATSEEKIKSERTRYLPQIALVGSYGTGFSTAVKSLNNAQTIPYKDQLQLNMYQGLGVNINMPLFSKGDWLKRKQQFTIEQKMLDNQKELTILLLEKQLVELEQKRIGRKLLIDELELISIDLQQIYEMKLRLYQEGKELYKELEQAFLEWQSNRVELLIRHQEYQQLLLLER